MTKIARTRIVNVRPKRGGKVELIIPQCRADASIGVSHLLKAAKGHVDVNGDDLAGWTVVSWDFAGRFATAWYNHQSSPVREVMIPTFVQETLRARIADANVRHTIADFLTNR